MTHEVTDDRPFREGCGCNLCNAPVVIPKYTDEERALRLRAQEDYRRERWTLLRELQARNGVYD